MPAAAQLINADTTEIAFMKNTTQGILIAANGIDWREGDNVVTTAVEFPANIYPWWSLKERYGVHTRMVPERDGCIHIEDIASAIDARTRALTNQSCRVCLRFSKRYSGTRRPVPRTQYLVHR